MKNILNILSKIGLIIVLVVPTLISLACAYIIFAPDEMPKPFYLVYRYPVLQASAEEPQAGKPQEESPKTTPAEPKATAPAAPLEIRPGQGIMVDTGTKIVNLVDPTGRRYLRVGIVLEFAPTDLSYYTMAAEEKVAFEEAFLEEINIKLPVMNNSIITLLASQTFDSVYTAEGKEDLRQKITDTINSQLPENRIIFVYFTEFVVQ